MEELDPECHEPAELCLKASRDRNHCSSRADFLLIRGPDARTVAFGGKSSVFAPTRGRARHHVIR